MFKNFIFDWSGTIVDDLGPVVAATNHVYAEHGLEALNRESFRREFSLPYDAFWQRILPNVTLEEVERLFRIGFSASGEKVTILPCARECLDAIRDAGHRLFILSSADAKELEAQAKELGLCGHFEEIFAGVIDKKSKLVEILSSLELNAEETCFVGDMSHDIESAQHAGVASIGVATGYYDPERLAASRPDMLLADLSALENIVASSSGRRPISTVGGLIENERGQLLMIRTHKWSDKWGIPGGKIRRGETSLAALEREISEETGLEVYDARLLTVLDSIDSPEFERSEHFLLQNYHVRTKSREVVLNDEAEHWKWVTLDDAFQLDLNKPTFHLLRKFQELQSRQTILINGLELHTHIGVPAEEREIAQTLLVNIELCISRDFGAMRDEISETVDYHALTLDFEAIATSHERKLIETLAADLCERALREDLVSEVSIRIQKKILPQTNYVGCSLTRRK